MHVQDMKNKSVGIHDFAMNPRADIRAPRSASGRDTRRPFRRPI